MMDPLTEALHDLRLRDSFYCRSELSAPWGLRIPRWDCASFHFVAEGRCFLRTGESTTRLDAGDLVLLPHGHGHELADDRSTPAEPVESLPHEKLGKSAAILRHGGSGDEALLICGGVHFEPHPLVELLPEVLYVGANDGKDEEWVELTLRIMAGEASQPRPGSETVMTRLADILVVGAVRVWLRKGSDGKSGWLSALRDAQIGRALVLMHKEAHSPWSVASLASEVHMSRASFAERFVELVGVPPMQYLTQRRMYLASGWIRDDNMGVGEVAQRLGYGSAASFSRGFKRTMGVAPGSLRTGSSASRHIASRASLALDSRAPRGRLRT
jgi:AraC-like DNA-binding protein